MSLADKHLHLCSCNGTMPLDANALAKALELSGAPAVRTMLCQKELAAFAGAAAGQGGHEDPIGQRQGAERERVEEGGHRRLRFCHDNQADLIFVFGQPFAKTSPAPEAEANGRGRR